MRRARIATGRITPGVARGVAAAALVSCVALSPVGAQGRLSEKGLVSQTVGNTTITVEYYRPVARGRVDLIPGVVHWGQWWTQSGFTVAFTIANGIASGFEVRVEDGAVTG